MNLQTYIADLISVLNSIVIPFMLGMAFLVFVINVFRFFILGGTNADSQDKAKRLAVYGVGAFVFIIIFWGIINLLANSFGLNRDCFSGQVTDYVAEQARLDGSPRSQVEPCAPTQPPAPTPDSLPSLPGPFNDPSPNRTAPTQPLPPMN